MKARPVRESVAVKSAIVLPPDTNNLGISKPWERRA